MLHRFTAPVNELSNESVDNAAEAGTSSDPYMYMDNHSNTRDTQEEITEPEMIAEEEVSEPEITEPEITEPEITEPEMIAEEEVSEPEITELQK